jgi:hypothetical protein
MKHNRTWRGKRMTMVVLLADPEVLEWAYADKDKARLRAQRLAADHGGSVAEDAEGDFVVTVFNCTVEV